MKIRKKITLWISGTALLSALIFSSFVFFELIEMPFTLIDNELQQVTQTLLQQMKNPIASGRLPHNPYPPDQYWIKVTDNQGSTLYRSSITRYTDLLADGNKTRYLTEKKIPRSQIWLGQDAHDDVLFRVMVTETQLDTLPIVIRIGKPIENFEEELLDLIGSLAISITLCTLIIIFVSYQLAGKIMNPIVTITRMATDISEKSLYKRIPLTRNKNELNDLSISLNKMFDRLQYSFQRQKEFIGNASHELKSPITLLMLAQEEMLINSNLSSKASRDLMKQLTTTRRMSHLVRNLLDLSRLEQQETLVRKPVNLKHLTNRVVEDYTELFAAKQIQVQNKMADELLLQGDPEKLFRLLINLVDNAIRYNFEENGRILLKGYKTNRGIQLEFSNTGLPIPESDIALVFEQFYRVEKSRSSAHGGSGLGLAIAKKIVDLHDGTIHIANEPEQLIKITVFLPLTDSPAE